MEYKIYKLVFSTPVHFGAGKLESSNINMPSDTLFSALCIEAKKLFGVDGINKLYNYAKNQCVIFSDLFPFCGNKYYLPKPMLKIEKEFSNSSVEKKKYKNTKYISADTYAGYINGELEEEPEFAREYVFTKLNKSRDMNQDSTPYFVGTYSFNKDCGLYFVFGYSNDEQLDFVDSIMCALGYDGIGGKVSSGLGKFIAAPVDLPDSIKALIFNAEKSQNLITISSCLPTNEELPTAIENARYTLQKRSGFIASDSYSSNNEKKRDLYTFSSGSVFTTRFIGDIYDVSQNGSHPVYRYAKPFFIAI